MSAPADELRAAARLLRETASKAKGERWIGHPWHVMECFEDECACIVYQGEPLPLDKSPDPPYQYVADAESAEHAAWIALMSPSVAKPLAAWLESAAKHAAKVRDPRNQEIITDLHALAVARAITGSTS